MDLAHPVFRTAASGDAVALNALFLEDPQLINRPDYDGNMPLHFAALSGSTACVQVCLEALRQLRPDLDVETEVQRRNFSGKDAACCAVIAGSMESLRLLLDAGARTDYRFATEIPVLVHALSGSDVELVRLVLESIEADFEQTHRDRYWFAALKPNLHITLEQYKLLKSYAVPYGIGDFEELYHSLIEWDPSTPGLEEFLVYLCTDAVDRWFRRREEVLEGLRRITSFFLHKLVPHTQTLDCVRHLQQLGVLEPPQSVRAWLRVLNEWGIPYAHISDPVVQNNLLLNLSTSSGPVPLVQDPSLLPLVLYFVTLSLKFPHPGWLSSWSDVCDRIGQSECSLATLFELHTVRHSRSAADFFWCEMFPLAVSRAIATLDSGLVSFHVAHEELCRLVDHIVTNCPAMQPDQLTNRETLLFKVLSSFPSSNNAPGHELFIRFVSTYLLPCVPSPFTISARPAGLITATVHTLSHRALLEAVLDYSAPLALFLLRNLRDWPHRALSHIDLLANCLLLAYAETEYRLALPNHLTDLLPTSVDDDGPFPMTAHSVLNSFRLWFNRILGQPLSLRTLAKRCVRLCIRRSLLARHIAGKQPLSHVVPKLPLPPVVKSLIVSCDLP